MFARAHKFMFFIKKVTTTVDITQNVNFRCQILKPSDHLPLYIVPKH